MRPSTIYFYSNPVGFDSGVFVTLYSTSSTTYTMDCRLQANGLLKVQAYDGKKYSGYSNTVITEIYQSDIDGGGGEEVVPQSLKYLPALKRGLTVLTYMFLKERIKGCILL